MPVADALHDHGALSISWRKLAQDLRGMGETNAQCCPQSNTGAASRAVSTEAEKIYTRANFSVTTDYLVATFEDDLSDRLGTRRYTTQTA